MILLSLVATAVVFSLLFIIYKQRKDLTYLNQLFINKEVAFNQAQKSEVNLKQELTSMESRLHHAIEDPLTKLLGWTLFEDRVRQSIHESSRYQFTMAILYVDINDFRMINEALGFAMGDAVLNEVSRRLQTCIRQVDSVSRLSKDIFAVVLTQLAKPETAAVVSQRILESLMQPITINEQKLYVTASIGISIYPTDGTDAALLFRNAEEALLMAKGKGTQNYQFYQEKNYANSLRELKLSTGLKRDSFLTECEIYYQPIVHAQDKSIFCMEAMLYWRHPELGLIHSGELSQYIEKHDKSNLALEWMIKKSCHQFLQWKKIGFNPVLLGISLGIRQLANVQFIYRISQILQECEFKPEWLLLEIEETLSQISFDTVEKSFNMLKYQQIKLAINHFGAGFFSIQDLKKFTVNYLKLDPALINDLEENKQSRELIHSIGMLAKSLDMQLIIQGVNSERQIKILTDLGCDLIQGQFIGEPRSENEITSAH